MGFKTGTKNISHIQIKTSDKFLNMTGGCTNT